ncbi:RNA polymerase factor sigma-54 [Aureimonas jatrophae]|uniref:RNA polymerase sigma-54 factor n=1 Tax=Aureimonas jatrophae TaxID=1166073 RepID=A0A1H0IMJ5_9HYPH|nr:RNA polymerase factor sigma-54 [Aureimonas jatrophae]MBB3952257.1 RNA polymerase sigma-54 factor [Aureimonas jatrophae]SDO32627.1 RNA polymerase, sigma 54 subunit, RpoN/SigL [Aureimonas jatrophae]
MLSVNLQVRQSQSLVMTPQLLQSIRLLQFDRGELQGFLEREAEGNPLLRVERAPGGTPVRMAPGSLADTAVRERAAPGPTLPAHALSEIGEIFPNEHERRIALHLFADLDASGFLAVDPIAVAHGLGLDEAQAIALLGRLQAAAEPAGLFARSLAESLAIQLERRDRLDPVMRVVLAHLPLLARRDFVALARLTGENESDLPDILAEIRRLDPRPGSRFEAAEMVAVVPDVLVAAADGGGWQIELNERAFPRVAVRETYARRIAAGCIEAEERQFLQTCQQSASWLLRSLDQRARTVLRVAEEIVRRQDGFLQHGVPGLRPMTLASVAEAIGLHESTVSRVTAGKYLATPRGTFEMKFFFTVAIGSSDGGEAHSAESVKLRIGRMIAAESVDDVLSDDDIAARLRSEGVDLARRTVAKYREALGLPSSVQRRREMKARRLAG